MGQDMDSRPPQVTWQSLNSRQQDYLTAIYHADQEVEANERRRWSRGGRPRPAVEWRWMVYATLDGHDTPVKRHLRSTKQISEGTGSTLEALEKRKLINVRYDITTYNGREILTSDPIPTIQITPSGRALVRQALDIRGGKQVVGTLQEWHWRALAKAYAAGSKGVCEEGLGYGRIGWKTQLIEVDNKDVAAPQRLQDSRDRIPADSGAERREHHSLGHRVLRTDLCPLS